jgi:hypothetical protein
MKRRNAKHLIIEEWYALKAIRSLQDGEKHKSWDLLKWDNVRGTIDRLKFIYGWIP